MQESQISFDLENTSTDKDAIVILVPAMLRRNASLAGKFLKAGDFKDETGLIVIHCTNEGTAGQIAELDEFAAQLQDIQVVGACVSTDNLTQATLNFIQKEYPAFKPAVVTNIDTVATLEAGRSAVNHSFTTPFKSGALRSLAIKLLVGQKVNVCLRILMPDLSGASASLPVLPNQ
ncbi:hypothetical protein GCM10027578_22150 [Spirosoma luteolum]